MNHLNQTWWQSARNNGAPRTHAHTHSGGLGMCSSWLAEHRDGVVVMVVVVIDAASLWLCCGPLPQAHTIPGGSWLVGPYGWLTDSLDEEERGNGGERERQR